MKKISKHSSIYFKPIFLIKCLKYLKYHSKDSITPKVIDWIVAKLFSNNIYLKDSATGIILKVNFLEYIPESILKGGLYSRDSINKTIEILQETSGAFIDIGANIGLFTICSAVSCSNRIIAIEGSPKNFLELKRNIELNNFLVGKIVLINALLADNDKVISFSEVENNNPGMNHIIKDENDAILGNSFLSTTVTLNKFIEYLQISQIALIKIDIEGYEYEVLSSINYDTSYRPKNILTEFHIDEESERKNCLKLLSFMNDKGYVPLLIDGTPYQNNIYIPDGNIWFKSIQ